MMEDKGLATPKPGWGTDKPIPANHHFLRKDFFIPILSTQVSLAASMKIKKVPKGTFDDLPKSACGG